MGRIVGRVALASVAQIKEALRADKIVYWRGKVSECKRNRNGSYTVNVQADKNTFIAVKLESVIKMYGFRDFYILEAT